MITNCFKLYIVLYLKLLNMLNNCFFNKSINPLIKKFINLKKIVINIIYSAISKAYIVSVVTLMCR